MKSTKRTQKPQQFCTCDAVDPICTECWKPTRLCNNWIERVTPSGIVFEKKQRLTKAQQKAFAAISERLKGKSALAVLNDPEFQKIGRPLKSLSRMDFLRGAMSEGAFGFPRP